MSVYAGKIGEKKMLVEEDVDGGSQSVILNNNLCT